MITPIIYQITIRVTLKKLKTKQPLMYRFYILNFKEELNVIIKVNC